MPTIRLHTRIDAPVERCFDLSRSIDLHAEQQSRHGETAIAGVTAGLIGVGEEVTWHARHFGIWQKMTSRITRFERPSYFRDEMVRGTFRKFEHDHYFEQAGAGTLMTDVCEFEAPLGFLGRIASRLVLTRYMTWLLDERARILRRVAESSDWKRFLPAG